MAVPAHDDRDFAFAIKYGLPIIPVIDRVDGLSKSFIMPGSMEAGFSKALNDAGISFYAEDAAGAGEALFVALRQDQVQPYVAW